MSTTLLPSDEIAFNGNDLPGDPLREASRFPHLSRESFSPWVVGAGAALAVSVLLRLWTRSGLWLDEVQTLDISRVPLTHLPAVLRQDGSPPLYYVLLHFWIGAFGTSTFAVRSLPALLGIATLPVAWFAGRDLGGRQLQWATVLLTASSPFAIWYSTDNRMYSLMILEVFLGVLALSSVRRQPRWWNFVLTSAATAALAYTHYWSFFLIGAVGILILIAALSRSTRRSADIYALGAVMAGCIGFLPWIPTFLFQLRHTGTPWNTPAGFSVFRDALLQFSGGLTDEGLGLELLLAFLLLLGVFATTGEGNRVQLDLATRPDTRRYVATAIGTLLLAIAGGKLASTGFQDRYAAVVFPPFVMVAGAGVDALSSRPFRNSLLGCAVVLGLFSASYDVTTQRTQAVQVASYLDHHAGGGDVIGYCPDQLAPDTSRLLKPGITQLAFPRGTGPVMVNWIDYLSAVRHSSPRAFANRLLNIAGPYHSVWLVWQGGYRGYGDDCRNIADDLIAARPLHRRAVNPDPQQFAESARLSEFPP